MRRGPSTPTWSWCPRTSRSTVTPSPSTWPCRSSRSGYPVVIDPRYTNMSHSIPHTRNGTARNYMRGFVRPEKDIAAERGYYPRWGNQNGVLRAVRQDGECSYYPDTGPSLGLPGGLQVPRLLLRPPPDRRLRQRDPPRLRRGVQGRHVRRLRPAQQPRRGGLPERCRRDVQRRPSVRARRVDPLRRRPAARRRPGRRSRLRGARALPPGPWDYE